MMACHPFRPSATGLVIPLTSHSATHLHKRDIDRVKKACYRTTDRAKALRRKARKIRKGLDDTQKRKEGTITTSHSRTRYHYHVPQQDKVPLPCSTAGQGTITMSHSRTRYHVPQQDKVPLPRPTAGQGTITMFHSRTRYHYHVPQQDKVPLPCSTAGQGTITTSHSRTRYHYHVPQQDKVPLPHPTVTMSLHLLLGLQNIILFVSICNILVL